MVFREEFGEDFQKCVESLPLVSKLKLKIIPKQRERRRRLALAYSTIQVSACVVTPIAGGRSGIIALLRKRNWARCSEAASAASLSLSLLLSLSRLLKQRRDDGVDHGHG